MQVVHGPVWDAESICCGSHVVVEHVISGEITDAEIIRGESGTGVEMDVVTDETTHSESSVLTDPVDTTPPQTAVTTPSTQPTRSETALPETALPTLQAVEPAAAVAVDPGVTPSAPVVTPAVALDAPDVPEMAEAPHEAPVPAATESSAPATAEDIIAEARADAPEQMDLETSPASVPSGDISDVAGDEPAPPTSVTPAAKQADNIFEEFEDEPADADTKDAAEAPASAEEEDPEAPAPAEPPAEPDPFDDVRHRPVEPLRRWIDASGEHATVGVLIDLRGDAAEIRKANGRTVIVPLGRLSVVDRAYAAEAGARLAARPPAPQPIDTAGL